MLPALAAALALQAAGPQSDPDARVLAIIDVETTGLRPGYHEMIDIGAVYTDPHGRVLGEFFVRITPDHPDRAGDIARSINGFDEARWAALGASGEAEAAAAFIAFHEEIVGERTALFTAFNAHFDRAFVDAWLKEEGQAGVSELFTYYMLDLPSLAWGRGYRGLNGDALAEAVGVEPETSDPMQHTGQSGAAWNLAFYNALMAAEPR